MDPSAILAVEDGEQEIAHPKRKAVPQRRVGENEKIKKRLVGGAKRKDGGKKHLGPLNLRRCSEVDKVNNNMHVTKAKTSEVYFKE